MKRTAKNYTNWLIFGTPMPPLDIIEVNLPEGFKKPVDVKYVAHKDAVIVHRDMTADEWDSYADMREAMEVDNYQQDEA